MSSLGAEALDPVTDPPAPPQTPGVDGGASPGFVDVYAGELSFVWKTLWRLGVPERDLEDVAHDVFVVVHRKLGDYDPTRPLKPWLFGICFRVALDRRRKLSIAREQLSSRHDDGADGTADGDGALQADVVDAPAIVERNEKKALVQKALATLPLEQRAVFVLHELDGLPIPACAEVLQAPLNTLYSRLRLARAAFTRFVERAGP